MRQLARYLDAFAGKRILVVGDLMLDEYLSGHIERISPEAPVPVLNLVSRSAVLGGAGNVVSNLCALGARVAVAGAIGQDSTGEQILASLAALGADTNGIVRQPERKSTRKTRLISLEHGQQVFRFDEEATNEISAETEDCLVSFLQVGAGDMQAIICSDYQKGSLSPKVLQAVFRVAHDRKRPAIAGPKGSNPEKYRGASALMANLSELSQLERQDATRQEWIGDAARRLMERLGLETLVVTRGQAGMLLFENASVGLRQVGIPTVARSVYDVTGAGDTAIAAFGLAVAAGAGWEDAAHLANLAAGVVVGKRGTASVTVEEIRARLHDDAGG